MEKIVYLYILIICLVSCKNNTHQTNNLEIAEQYYTMISSSDDSLVKTIIGDSIIIRESEDNYEERFSQSSYEEWLKWDSVFEPNYEILDIKIEDEKVKARISKIDKRIKFLHEEPIIWNEVIIIKNNRIVKVDRIHYENFNIERLIKNRAKLTEWIKRNHPELDGFIFDQTANGGLRYLKALELYKEGN